MQKLLDEPEEQEGNTYCLASTRDKKSQIINVVKSLKCHYATGLANILYLSGEHEHKKM